MSESEQTDGDLWAELVKRESLTRRVTLDEHMAKFIASGDRDPELKEKHDRLRDNLESRFQPGDEFWEWVLESEPHMQMGGIALVRGGAIVWVHNEWAS